MLPKKRRVDKNSFKKLFKNGKTIKSEVFTLKIRYTGNSLNKFSVVVPISVEKMATKRNKLKRRGRSILVKNIDKIKNGIDVAVFIKKEAKDLKFADFNRELTTLLEKSGLLGKKQN
ncbi:MAG: ribonuclease P protein component [Parcubacteria group bacterium CG10_big_fil_rev_8_21_14_0_10_38_31]|nr:MAG: ribonuclease P protein component [Parcubacteria group bacterium CG10_big_fil_rev_8_21_14_0_10_38_31]